MDKIQGDFSGNEKIEKTWVKNKFIIFVIFLIVAVFLFVLLSAYFHKTVDRNSYAVLLNGNAQLNDELLVKDIKNLLETGDVVKTIGESSLAVLEWGDGSVTRLGGNTSVKVDELYVSDDKSDIKIGFELLAGKTWSNIISFLGAGSHFEEYFRDSVAAVRGTVFNLDLDNDYLVVKNHKLDLIKPTGDTVTLDENKPFNVLNFDFINLDDFVNRIKDVEWENINISTDNSFLSTLKDNLNRDIDKLVSAKDIDFDKLSNNVEEKEKVYKKVLSDYQKLNFVGSEDNELFGKKLEIKETLIKLASGENKERLTKSTLYDFKDIIKTDNLENLGQALKILDDNKDFISEIDFNNFFKNGIITEKMRKKLEEEQDKLRNIFGETFNEKLLKPLDTIKSIEEKGSNIIHNALDSGYEKIGNLINK